MLCTYKINQISSEFIFIKPTSTAFIDKENAVRFYTVNITSNTGNRFIITVGQKN